MQIGVDGEKGLWECGVWSCIIHRLQGAGGWCDWVTRAAHAEPAEEHGPKGQHAQNSCWCLPFQKTGPIYQKMSQLWIFMCCCLLLLCFLFFCFFFVRRHEFIVNCYSTYSSKMSRTFPVLPAGGMVVPHPMHRVPPCPASDPTHPAWGAVDAASSCLLEVSPLQTLCC